MSEASFCSLVLLVIGMFHLYRLGTETPRRTPCLLIFLYKFWAICQDVSRSFWGIKSFRFLPKSAPWNVNSVNSYQIPGSLNFAFHNAALLLGSWWEVMKIWHFPQTEDIFWWFQSGHVHSFSIRILSQETALELTVEVKDETWVFKNPTERSRNVQWTLNIQSWARNRTRKNKTSYTLYTGNGMLVRTMFQAILTAKTNAKEKKQDIFVTSGIDQNLSIILHLNPKG